MTEQGIEELALLAQARLDSKIDVDALWIQQHFRNYPTSCNDNAAIDDLALVKKTLKRLGYNGYGNLYTKGFVCFELELKENRSAITSIKVWMDIPKRKTDHQIITESFITGVVTAANYYERL